MVTMATARKQPKPAACIDPDDNDMVADMLRIMLDIWPDLAEPELRRAEAQIRDRWGGDRPYIARRIGQGRSARNDAIRRDHRAGERVPLLARRYQISERRVQQILTAPDG